MVDTDGGITLWISYDNLDAAPDSVDPDPVESRFLDFPDIKVIEGEATCDRTNEARTTHGESDDVSYSCGTGACTGKAKLEEDIKLLADYIYESTNGRHFLRRAYVADGGRGWATADVQWNVGGSAVTYTVDPKADTAGWYHSEANVHLHSARRECNPDVLHHELGHYLYELPDRYPGVHAGCSDDAGFPVRIHEASDPYAEPTVMSGGFPHRFVDRGNAELVVSYLQVTEKKLIPPEPESLSLPPYRAPGCTVPFAKGEWSQLPDIHVDLTGAHPIVGDFPKPTLDNSKKPEIHIIGSDQPYPGTILLLDNSNSMNLPADDPASRYVHEAALYFYHSSTPSMSGAVPMSSQAAPEEYVGAFSYNADVLPVFEYAKFDPDNPPEVAGFPEAIGPTNIAQALDTAINTLDASHKPTGPNGATIILLSDGKPTIGGDMWAQVRRANELGIRIHTRSYGIADSETLNEIAAYSSASAGVASAPTSAAELKLDLCRDVTTLRGATAIYSCKEKVGKADATCGAIKDADADGEYLESGFEVPPGTRDLLFYVFLREGNAAELDIELSHGSDSPIRVAAQELTKMGRFNGVRVLDAESGAWGFKIRPRPSQDGSLATLPAEDDIEIVAYAQHPELNTEAWIDEGDGTTPPTLKARLIHRYPLTSINARAVIYRGGRRARAPLVMEEGKGGGDYRPDDGVYSAKINLDQLRSDLGSGRIRIDVEFMAAGDQARPARDVAYEPGTRWEDVRQDYIDRMKPSSFKAYATLVTNLSTRDPIRPTIVRTLPRRIRPRKTGRSGGFSVTVKNAHPLSGQVRVSLGEGVSTSILTVVPHRRRFRTSLGVVFKIDDSATPGPRDLKLQFGRTILEQEEALRVKAP